jgi:hypothetical protein
MTYETEIEFLEWVNPRFGVMPIKMEDGKPVILKVKMKLPKEYEDELERERIKSALWKERAIAFKSAYDVEVGWNEQNTPQQRTWVGLTKEDKESFWTADQMTKEEWDELFDTVEAKLKEKNTIIKTYPEKDKT